MAGLFARRRLMVRGNVSVHLKMAPAIGYRTCDLFNFEAPFYRLAYYVSSSHLTSYDHD